ncbi:hypothetical protein EYR41_008311 [Orbilia oligospora]|uniref:Uncharacterized protein n=1 Tax=Orbilia oligospora TaxID=2813651 RepID=A0A7C8K330_ORBOL|nr:hypothetical protein TWF751_011885 [Orbilia oligospora]TGJ66703.1 hypothetical protein EYR41_008311 [Orbilia oligospora]
MYHDSAYMHLLSCGEARHQEKETKKQRPGPPWTVNHIEHGQVELSIASQVSQSGKFPRKPPSLRFRDLNRGLGLRNAPSTNAIRTISQSAASSSSFSVDDIR